jgi:nucleotide-binding universal stress UspA family protein
VSHHILVAVDGSRDSDQALEQSIRLAQEQQARLTLITVVESESWTASLALGATPDKLAAGALADALTILNRASDRVPFGINVTTVASYPPICQALIRQIEDGQPDLVMMGSRGRGNKRGVELGSISRHVLHHSVAPVLIAQAETGPADPGAPVQRQQHRDRSAGAGTRFGTQIRPVGVVGQGLRHVDQQRNTVPTRRWQVSHEPELIERITGGNDEHGHR